MSEQRSLSRRLWDKDLTLWHPVTRDPEVAAEVKDRLGWLDVFDWLPAAAVDIIRWADEIAASGRFARVVVLGMGGSSLAPLVLSDLFAPRVGYPVLSILDSTDPEMVDHVVQAGVTDTLFIVASKSGTTLETMDLYRFLFDQAMQNSDTPGDQFIAITDPGSWLEGHADDAGFLKTFVNPPEIGGRYSALSYFGMVPAALHGIDIEKLVARAQDYAERTRDGRIDDAEQLGIRMATEARAGRDKMRLLLDKSLDSVGAWIEQLVAESTGKEGKGILPVVLAGSAAQNASLPVSEDAFEVAVSVADPLEIGVVFFRWECATAIAASLFGINPFDQPNVAEAKQSTNRFIAGEGQPVRREVLETELLLIETPNDSGEIALPARPAPGNYVALLAYLPMMPALTDALQQLRAALADQHKVQTTLGFGPRYLHSTGQLHKGGPATGVYVIIDDAIADDVDDKSLVPGRDYTFSKLIAAQADGDHAVLVDHGLPVMRVGLKGDRLAAIKALTDALIS